MTREEMIAERKKFLKQMNDYIINLGDEEVWYTWIGLGVPDGATEDDYDFMAENDATWRETCELFGNLIKVYDR
jgi:hypothetical protein